VEGSPGAQSAEEVAEVILDAIRDRATDVSTRPGYADQARRYHEDMDAFERTSFASAPRKD
jgi:hypothetical protein